MVRVRELANSRRAAAVGALVTAGVGLSIALNGITVPWWAHGDPDGTYVGSSLDILGGYGTQYLDHPGLPTQVGLALAFGADHLARRVGGRVESRSEYVDRRLLDLDALRPAFRTWAVLQYVGGALLVFGALLRYLRHWTWGLAGALLFLAAPGLAEISSLLRPDPLLAALCLVIAVAIAIAFETRSAGAYLGAAALLGLAVTVKLTAVGLAPSLVVAAIIRRPRAGWARPLWGQVRTWAYRHRRWLVPVVAIWLLVAVFLNTGRSPFVKTDAQRSLLLVGAAVVGGYLGYALIVQQLRLRGADRIFVPFYGALMLAFVGGLFVPASFALDAGAEMTVSIRDTLTGGGVNAGVEAFSEFTLANFQAFEQRAVAVVGGLAAAAAFVGAWRRRWSPALLTMGAAVLATMAAARTGWDYYFAPAYAVAIPPALWLLRARDRPAVPALAWGVVLLVLLPTFWHLPRWSKDPTNADAIRIAEGLLAPGEVIIAPSPYLLSLEDTWYRYLVEGFIPYVPEYPYRFFDVGELDRAVGKGLRPRYAVAPVAELPTSAEPQQWSLSGYGPFVARRLPLTWGAGGAFGVVELLQLPTAT